VRAAQAIDDFACLVLPALPYGLAPYNMGWIGSVTLEIETAIAVLHDICRSVHQHGFRKIVLVNGHGDNMPLMGAVASKLSQREIFLGTTSIWDLGAEALRRSKNATAGQSATPARWRARFSCICGRSWWTWPAPTETLSW